MYQIHSATPIVIVIAQNEGRKQMLDGLDNALPACEEDKIEKLS